ncbi:MAG: 2'-5' RNA ligase family protein [Janthinobacterium lividum]
MNATALIVTLQMDPVSAEHFTSLRQAHFPSGRNWLSAHLTLFHALPMEALDAVLRDVADVVQQTQAFEMTADRLLFLGRGVAYGVASPQAVRVRGELAARWRPLLSRQDSAWHGRLHITVQNKVELAVARALHAELQRGFTPRLITATGLQIWNYVGGPWEPVATLPFID